MGNSQWAFFIALALFGIYNADSSISVSTRQINTSDGTSMKWTTSINMDNDSLPSTAESRHRLNSTGVNQETSPGNNTLDSDDKIVGGDDTTISSYPYQLQMNLFGSQACGAAILSKDWVVTAAHCLYDSRSGRPYPLRRISFRAGSTYRGIGGQVHTVERSVVPQRYTPGSNDYDFALLKVTKPFQLSYLVQPIRLPSVGEEVPVGSNAILTGWGDTVHGGRGSTILQKVSLPVVSQSRCQQNYRLAGITLSPRMVCAGIKAKDTCQGDSGGPMAVNGKLVGVVSFGIGCGDERFPGVYSKVSVYRNFIKEITGI